MESMVKATRKMMNAVKSIKPDGTFDVNPEYTAILRLDKMLTKAQIPHLLDRAFDGWIVIYPSREDSIGDAVQHFGSYGAFSDMLEVYGFGLKRPDGFLSVESAFEYFKKAHLR